jgi:hypothetical protein
MDGVKALVVLASIYYPGDGIMAKNNYQTSSGQRYDQSAPKCAALKWPLGTMLHLVHGRNNIDVTINDHDLTGKAGHWIVRQRQTKPCTWAV